MNKNKNLFEKNNKNKKTFKYLIVTFIVFFIALSVASVFLFMYSLDFNLDNFIDKPEEESTSETVTETSYSVNSLSGKSTVLFVCVDDEESLSFAFTVMCDFDDKSMSVKCIDSSSSMMFNNRSELCGEIYDEYSVEALKSAFSQTYDININKFFICNYSSAKEILSLFDGIKLNVNKSVNYNDANINLELEQGEQVVSGTYAFNYLLISDNRTREQIVCDIIASVLTPEYVEDSYNLFTSFINEGKTDISVIDYSESIDNLKVYTCAEDKFLPKPMTEAD